MMNVQLAELFQNQAFVEKTAMCETVDEVLDMVKSAGVDTTREEFDELMDAVAQHINCESGELDEQALETVSGGAFWTAAAIVSIVIAGVGALKWYIYDEPYQRGKANAKAKNNKKKNKIC